MMNNTTRDGWGLRIAALVVISLLAVIGAATPASADDDDRIRLRGVGLPGNPGEGECLPDAFFGIVMTGTLEGCVSMYPETFSCVTAGGVDNYVERGREVFVGTVAGGDDDDDDDGGDDNWGTFATTYVLRATMVAGSGCDFAEQLAGGCVHRIVRGSGTGAFEDARGVIRFTDRIEDPPDWATDFPYRGRLILDD